ncbi:hypothetical protein SUGI_0293490 [Cryptomeria japonica]|nr:hypothetical protein SUGI_0293490 [Cryptomeria japonica]
MDMSNKNSLSSSTVTGTNSVKNSNDMTDTTTATLKLNECNNSNKTIENLKNEKPEYGSMSGKSSISRASCSSGVSDSNESICSSFSSAINKPHKANDSRWEAIQLVKSRDTVLGLSHFRLLKRLGCGDIGSVYLAELRGTNCYFAMKFCSGGDLHTLRQRQPNKHFSESAARFYASEVLLSLEYLHMLGIVYRDLKPENVLVREEGHIMLSDFDLSLRCAVSPTLVKSTSTDFDPSRRIPAYCIQPACIEPSCVTPACIQPSCFVPRFLPQRSKKNRKPKNEIGISANHLPELMAEPTSARSMSFVGTHEYLAPEIIKGEGHGSAVDWWTFGIFLYELLHGKTPFKGSSNRATLYNVVGNPLKFPDMPSVSFAARDLIRGLLVKDPQHRLAYKRGATEIKQHPFFEGVNWALIRSTTPPEIPKPFDFEFTVNRTMPSTNSAQKKVVNSDVNSSSSYLDFDFF